ncbi:hypothetical protein SAMN05216276_1005162 [Streptosporangium subroseum]|uniref:Secreted protein n=1 Tax=Streptosporangium subroseum TaxID=106412 RepID=A0A239CE59_9ACTN|nr:hypothetical protein [Streptosporangium subroseum]SNS18536.1 hypothetical protein SAMN05216276_1005162 [Streptosporangium subroseum]
MMKKMATGLLALAATGALAFATPATASAATSATATAATATTAAAGSSDYDYSDYWGSYFSSNHKAKARGWIGVEWDKHQKWNSVRVKGSLYDLDHRTYKQGGKCAYVKFAVHHFGDHDGQWYDGKSYTYCGAGGAKQFQFSKNRVDSVRVKVCQIPLHSSSPTRCGDWEYLYTAESE